MKRLWCVFLLLAICACSNKLNIEYDPTIDGGCEYTEVYRPRKYFFDYFGCRDTDLSVKYAGVKCETIIKEELQDNIHKTPYNGVPVINEMPPLKVDVENNN